MQRRPCLCGTRRSQQRTPRRGRQARIRVPEGAVARQEGFGCTRTQPVRLVATKEWPTQEHRRAHVSNRRSEQIPTTPSTADRCKPQEHGRRSQARAGARGRVARVTPSAKGRRGDGARASPRPRHGATGTHRDVPVEARRADLAARRAERRGAHHGGWCAVGSVGWLLRLIARNGGLTIQHAAARGTQRPPSPVRRNHCRGEHLHATAGEPQSLAKSPLGTLPCTADSVTEPDEPDTGRKGVPEATPQQTQ
eukprot:gene11528-biopygen11962